MMSQSRVKTKSHVDNIGGAASDEQVHHWHAFVDRQQLRQMQPCTFNGDFPARLFAVSMNQVG